MWPTSPLRPVRRFTAGVTGHRAEALRALGSDEDALTAALNAVLRRVELCAGVQWSRDCTLVSGLATGADQLAASVALARDWALTALLPLPVDDYVDDFGDDARNFRHLLTRATSTEICPPSVGRDFAYEAAGRAMLARSDLLIAIWDGAPARGRGGTGQIVAEAITRRVPVLHVDPTDPGHQSLLWEGANPADLEVLLGP